MGRKRHSTTASYAGPSAGYGKAFFSALAGAEDAPDRLFIDSTLHQGPPHGGRRKRGGTWPMVSARHVAAETPRSHALCDVKGRPCVLMITPGNVHDMKVAKACIAGHATLQPNWLATKAMDSNDLRAWLAERGTTAVIPSKRNRKVQLDCDPKIYKQRNVIGAHVLPLQGLAKGRNSFRSKHQNLHGNHRHRSCRPSGGSNESGP